MTDEKYIIAHELIQKIGQCDKALGYMTHGTYHKHSDADNTTLPLPDEVCVEIRKVIKQYRDKYEEEFKAL